MTSWRVILLQHRWLALALALLALLAKIAVPAGFMLSPSHGTIVVSLCTGHGPATAALPLGRHAQDGSGGPEDGKKAGPPCAFSGLGMAATTAVDTIQLAIAIAFILSLGFLPAPPPSVRTLARLRPPLRAPPLLG